MHVPLPQESRQRIGHQQIWNDLTQAYHKGQFPPNILLAGPKGIGKATLAYHLARYLFAEGHVEAYADPETPSNRQITTGAHPDLFVLSQDMMPAEDQGKEISAERCRALVTFFQQKPMYGHWRVALVDSLDQLHPRGAQSLLKILEEPPAHAILILVTHHVNHVLPTIRSRCQLFQCPSLTPHEMQQVLKQLQLNLDPDMEAMIMDNAYGSIGEGLDLVRLGGPAFYNAMLAALKGLSTQHFSPALQFVDQVLLKNETLDPQLSWNLGLRALLRWIADMIAGTKPTASIQELQVVQALQQHTTVPQLIQAWFQAHQLINMTQTFHLDKRHAFMCILTSLIKFDQRP